MKKKEATMFPTDVSIPFAKMVDVMRLTAADPCICGALDVKVCRRCYTQALLAQLEPDEATIRNLALLVENPYGHVPLREKDWYATPS
jgi:hypothetical protein